MYKPNRLIDTAGMSEDVWLKVREHGPYYDDPSHPDYLPYSVGGSTVAGILGISPWVTPLEIWEQKRGLKPDNPEEFGKKAKEAGHVWEDYVALMFTKMEGYEDTEVFNDTGFYQHPYYPFATADLDRRVIHNGKEGILEIKTTNYRNYETIKKWKSGIVPLYYEYQCRWYMAIMNVNYTYICCSWGFTTNDMVVLKIVRDVKLEDLLLKEVSKFIESVENNIPPSMSDVESELAIKAFKKLYSSDSSSPTKKFDSKFFPIFSQLKQVKQEQKALKERHNTELKELEAKKLALEAKIIGPMKRSELGFVEKDEEKIFVSYKTKFRNGIDSTKLKKEEPEIYQKYKKVTSSRTLTLLDEFVEDDPE